MTRITRKLLLLGGVLSAGPLLGGAGIPHLSAQMLSTPPPGADTGPELVGFVGVLQPLSDLTEDPTTFGMAIPPDLLMGGEATWWASPVVGIGVMGLYSPATLNPVGSAGPGRTTVRLGELEYMTGMANLTFRLPVVRVHGVARALRLGGGGAPATAVRRPCGAGDQRDRSRSHDRRRAPGRALAIGLVPRRSAEHGLLLHLPGDGRLEAPERRRDHDRTGDSLAGRGKTPRQRRER